jgi:hypothetical protein
VEVELALKAPRRLEAICRAWARCRQVAGVLYVASDEARGGVERAVERSHAGEHVVVVSLDALAAAPRHEPGRGAARNVAVYA